MPMLQNFKVSNAFWIKCFSRCIGNPLAGKSCYTNSRLRDPVSCIYLYDNWSQLWGFNRLWFLLVMIFSWIHVTNEIQWGLSLSFKVWFKVLTQCTVDFWSSYVLGNFCGVSSSVCLRPVVASALTWSSYLFLFRITGQDAQEHPQVIPSFTFTYLFTLLGSVCMCHACMLVCVYMCAVYTCADVCACGYSSEGQKSDIPLIFSTLFFEAESLIEPGAQCWRIMASQVASDRMVSTLLCWDCKWVQLLLTFHSSGGDQN